MPEEPVATEQPEQATASTPPQPRSARPTLYKANVKARWRNRISGRLFEVRAGGLVSFDDGDFNEPGGPTTAALTSLQDVLDRGLFEVFDPAHAGDVDYMSRDELREVALALGLGGDDGVPHDADADALREQIRAHMDAVAAAPAKAAPPRNRRP